MILHAGIRPLIVSLLFLVHPGKNHPLPPGNRLTMTKKSCQDSIGNVGICMFKYDCIRQKGITLATCVDGFLFGACCMLKDDSFQDEIKEESNLISESYIYVTGIDFSDTLKHIKQSGQTSESVFPFPQEHISSTTQASQLILTATTEKNSSPRNESILDPLNNLSYISNASTLNPFENSSSNFFNSTTESINTYTHIKSGVSDEDLWNSSPDSTFINIYTHDTTTTDPKDESNSSILFASTLSEDPKDESISSMLFSSTLSEYPSTDFSSNSTESITQTSEIVTKNYQTTYDLNELPYDTSTPIGILSSFPHKNENISNETTVDPFSFSIDDTKETEVNSTDLLPSESVSQPFSSIPQKGISPAANSSYEATRNDSSAFESITTKHIEIKPPVPSLLQWSTEPSIPESLQSLIAQLTSQEISSPLNLSLKVPSSINNNIQTFEPSNLLITDRIDQINSNDSRNENFEEHFIEQNSTSEQESIQFSTYVPDLYETVSVFVTSPNEYVHRVNESVSNVLYHLNETEGNSNYSSNYSPFEEIPILSSLSKNKTDVEYKQPVVLPDFSFPDELFNSTFISEHELITETAHSSNAFPTKYNSTQFTVFIPQPVEEITEIELGLDSKNVNTNSTASTNLKTTELLNEQTKSEIYKTTSSFISDYEQNKSSEFPEHNSDKTIVDKNNNTIKEIIGTGNVDNINPVSVNNNLEKNYSSNNGFVTTQMPHFSKLESPSYLEELISIPFEDPVSSENPSLSYTESEIPSHDTILTIPSKESMSVTTEASKIAINNSTSSFDIISLQTSANEEIVNMNYTLHNSYVSANMEGEEGYSHVTDHTAAMKPFSQTTLLDFISNSTSNQDIMNADNVTTYYSNTEHDSLLNSHRDQTTTSIYSIPSEYQNISTLNSFNFIETLTDSMDEIAVPVSKITPSTLNISGSIADTRDIISVTVSSSDNKVASSFSNSNNSLINSTTLPPIQPPETNLTTLTTVPMNPPATLDTFTTGMAISSITSSEQVSISSYDTTLLVVSPSTVPENSSILNAQTVKPTHLLSPTETFYNDSQTINHQYQDVPGLTNSGSVSSMTSVTSNLNFTSQEATMMGTTLVTTHPSTVLPYPDTTTESYRWNYKKDCGVRLLQPLGRIVGGKNSYYGKWPWQALVKEATWLGLFVKNKCGGVLITAKYVLTAAHCQPGFFASLLVILGTHDLAGTFDNKASIIRNVKRMVVHRHYNAQTFENDLALLEMESGVEFLPHVVPICLPHRNEDFTGKMAFVTGWGKLTHGGDVPNILQEVQVPIVENEVCQRMFFHAGHKKSIRSNFVCAGYTNGGQDSCEGDSGGPLMVQREDKRWVLVGTVSHGIGCADPNLPGVYMRMSAYRPWIDSIIKKH